MAGMVDNTSASMLDKCRRVSVRYVRLVGAVLRQSSLC